MIHMRLIRVLVKNSKQLIRKIKNKFSRSSSQLQSRSPDKKHFCIAVITKSYAAIPQQTFQSFQEYLDKKKPGAFSYHLFDGLSDERLTTAYTNHVVQKYQAPYDAILTIGAHASQIAAQTSRLNKCPIPVIFTCVAHPSHLGIAHENHAVSNVSGIWCETPNFDARINTLCKLKSETKHALLPYNPRAAWLTQEANSLRHLLALRGIEVTIVKVDKTENLKKIILPYIDKIDTILTLRDDVITRGMDEIIELCNTYGKTAYTSDLASVKQGAALGFAASQDNEMGIEAAKYMLKLFETGTLPQDLPIKKIRLDYKIGLNQENLARQGVYLSPRFIENLDRKIIYTHKREK